MNDVFGDPTPQESEGVKPIDQSELQPQTPQQPEQGEPGEAAPPAAGTVRQVPLEALEAERKGRQDWKEKAIRFEEEARQLRMQMQDRASQQQSPQERDPVVEAQTRLENVILNASERAARKEYGTEVVDKAFERLRQEFAQNPALHRQVMNAADPWDEVVKQGKRLLAMDEIGADPDAFRKKVRAEIEAELKQPSQAQQPAALGVPQSLAGARSAGARGTTWTGPQPIDTLFNN